MHDRKKTCGALATRSAVDAVVRFRRVLDFTRPFRWLIGMPNTNVLASATQIGVSL
jgi:hypothetical protein